MELTVNTPLTQLPGIGEARGKKLEKLGLRQAGDFLHFFPKNYEDRRKVWTIRTAPLEGKCCIRALAAQTPVLSRVRGGLELVRVQVVDDSGSLWLTFFNQSYVQRAIQPGEEYIFYGAVEQMGSRRSMTNPVFERADRQSVTGSIIPIYPLTAGISNHLMLQLARQTVPLCARQVRETLPAPIRREHQLAGAEYACRTVHFPPSFEELEVARRRLCFEELFCLSLGLSLLRGRRQDCSGAALPPARLEDFTALLPFPPTQAQLRVFGEIDADLSQSRPMNRLVQGDVGSGKTAVAAYAAWRAIQGGYQAALMAPTEVLAAQHANSLNTLLEPAGIRVGLFLGSSTAKEKREARKALAAGEIQLAIGTHALLSEGVEFQNLSLVVADEQHRFGVGQRSALAEKAKTPPHVLVMSATPIPRTLALIVYGDLDVSVIDQLPPGRTPVKTYVVGEDKRTRMYNFVQKLVAEGRQAYLVCPAVEGEEEQNLKSVKAYAQELQTNIFPHLRVGLLHGKMRPKEKDRVMSAFAAGELQILVSTTVIEVGVDVPNAALMVVENAERFGLSQLHQLRGRVGRGGHESFCVLVTASRNPDSLARLRTLASTTDGFRIAEEDLKLRGPGDFFGSRQHGLPQLKVADFSGDMRVLRQAQDAAQALLAQDRSLSRPEHAPLLERVRELFSETPGIFN